MEIYASAKNELPIWMILEIILLYLKVIKIFPKKCIFKTYVFCQAHYHCCKRTQKWIQKFGIGKIYEIEYSFVVKKMLLVICFPV